MTIHEIRTLYVYNTWANARFIEVLDQLTNEQLTKRIESSYPSILSTFAHLVAAEWVWLQRWTGANPSAFPEWSVHPVYEKLKTKLAEIDKERRLLLASLNDSDLARLIDYKLLNGTAHRDRWLDLFVHVVNHSSYHRGQLTTLIRQAGGTPVATDFIVFKRSREINAVE